jgi:hypothetical protein
LCKPSIRERAQGSLNGTALFASQQPNDPEIFDVLVFVIMFEVPICGITCLELDDYFVLHRMVPMLVQSADLADQYKSMVFMLCPHLPVGAHGRTVMVAWSTDFVEKCMSMALTRR